MDTKKWIKNVILSDSAEEMRLQTELIVDGAHKYSKNNPEPPSYGHAYEAGFIAGKLAQQQYNWPSTENTSQIKNS